MGCGSSSQHAPDYHTDEAWASLPAKTADAEGGPADFVALGSTPKVEFDAARACTFFVHPTVVMEWTPFRQNMDWSEKGMMGNAEEGAKVQGAVFNAASRVYCPRYRAGTIDTCDQSTKQSTKAYRMALGDVIAAFEVFISTYCLGGLPFILAGHAPGAELLAQLIKDVVEPDARLRGRLVCAYLVGLQVGLDTFAHIKPSSKPDDTGCFAAWCTTTTKLAVNQRADGYTKKREDPLAQIALHPITVNPLAWDMRLEYVSKQHNPGSLKVDGTIVRSLTGCQCTCEGVLQIDDDENPAARESDSRAALEADDYHCADFALFWEAIRENACVRVAAWHAASCFWISRAPER